MKNKKAYSIYILLLFLFCVPPHYTSLFKDNQGRVFFSANFNDTLIFCYYSTQSKDSELIETDFYKYKDSIFIPFLITCGTGYSIEKMNKIITKDTIQYSFAVHQREGIIMEQKTYYFIKDLVLNSKHIKTLFYPSFNRDTLIHLYNLDSLHFKYLSKSGTLKYYLGTVKYQE